MGRSFTFEAAPDLPGSDRFSKYLFAGLRKLSDKLWDFEIEGRENIPLDGPAVITPNHLSFCDSVFVPAALPRRVWAIGKGEYMDSWKTKHIFPAMGMIPVDRAGGDAAQAALDTAATVLESGRLFMIYPEGTRSRSGNLHKGRTGAARLAIRCNAPIVPVGHEGTLAVQPPDSVIMKTHKPVSVRIGTPMWAKDFGDPADPRTLRIFTDAVMFEIAQLSGQKYVDAYASSSDTPDNVTAHAVGTERDTGKDEGTSRDTGRDTGRDRDRDDDDTFQRLTPTRPSVVGVSPTTIPRPPSRAHAADSNGSAHGASVTVPSGRTRVG